MNYDAKRSEEPGNVNSVELEEQFHKISSNFVNFLKLVFYETRSYDTKRSEESNVESERLRE